MTTDSARARSRPAQRRRTLRPRPLPPSDRPWEHLTAEQRLDRLLAANAPIGHDLSSLSIAETLHILNVRFGLVPQPGQNDPPASYMQEVARALRAAAREHGDMRGARAIENALADFNLGMRPMDRVPQGWELVLPKGMRRRPLELPQGAWYVASSSTARRCYLVHPGRGCGCTAARCGNECRHEQLIQMIRTACERWEIVLETLGLAIPLEPRTLDRVESLVRLQVTS